MPHSSLIAKNRIPRPVIAGDYVNIYQPKTCRYQGHTVPFQKNRDYDTWIVNDHCFVRNDCGWHIFGITHPKPDDFISDYVDGEHVHAGEEQLFHAFGRGDFQRLLAPDAMKDCDKILWPSERPDEAPAIHAPHIMIWDGHYRLVYGPHQIRSAVSDDLYHFKPLGTLFEGHASARDPNVFIDDDGTIYVLYASQNTVCYRTTRDMQTWSDERLLQTNPYQNGTSESPFMIKRDGLYYLLWCIWDATCGSYDNRTFVFGSETIAGFERRSPLTILPAHAPEIIRARNGDWYISSAFYPYNGVSVAPLAWE